MNGHVVVLNGTASAGKTTLAAAVKRLGGDSWTIVAQDDFAQALVPDAIAFVSGGPGFNFVRTDDGSMHVEAGTLGQQVLAEYRRATAAAARSGSDVVVDECMFDSNGWAVWQAVLDLTVDLTHGDADGAARAVLAKASSA